MNLPTQRRKRGVKLTLQGWKKLQAAKGEVEERKNLGNRYTYEDLSELSGLSVDTINKIFSHSSAVDRQSLISLFSTFNLNLDRGDYDYPKYLPKSIALEVKPEFPGGQIPLNSPFYIDRPPIESRCQETILEKGTLIRIKAPKLMGKTSLMARVIEQARNKGYRTVVLNFQLADEQVYADLDRFLQWFCACVGKGLDLPNQLPEYWDEVFGSNYNATDYFENYLLAEIDSPLVLALDNVDRVFAHPEIASDFFGLLRAWYEKAKYGDNGSDIWQKLRLVVVHSTEVYIPLNLNQSPFNVGLSVELPLLTSSQVQELARRYELDWSTKQVEQLMSLVGGHPHLVRLALYHIGRQDVSLEKLLQTPATASGIYCDHLRRQLWNLQKYPELMAAFATVVKALAPVELDLVQAFKLQSLGLVHLQGSLATPSCKLYCQYFRDRLNSTLSNQAA